MQALLDADLALLMRQTRSFHLLPTMIMLSGGAWWCKRGSEVGRKTTLVNDKA